MAAVEAEHPAIHRVAVAWEVTDDLAGRDIPQDHRGIAGSGQGAGTIRTERYAIHPGLSREATNLGVVTEIPESQCSIIRAGERLTAIWAERHTIHRGAMPIEEIYQCASLDIP